MLKKVKEFIKKRYKLLIILAAIIAGVFFFFRNKAKSEESPLIFEQPQYRDIVKKLEVSGVVDAKRKAIMRFPAGSKIVYLGAQEGDFVKKWQTIATVDRRSVEKTLQKNLNTYMKERWDWDQQIDDIEDRSIDKEEQRTVDQNQWDLENKVIDVELQKILISDTVMSSPFEGILVYSPTNVTGVQLLATDYFEVVDPQSLIFMAKVDEEDIAKLKKDQPANIVLDAYPDENITSNLNYIAYSSNTSAAETVFIVEFPLESELELPLEKYRLGMNGDAKIELAKKQNVLTIPFTATKERDSKTFVDIKNDLGATEERKIEIGLETDDWVEVISGLSQDDSVLIPQAE
ncbi:MAG: efflux RND transporter periplasmic adaptor subunit [Patescibacteria group bacterium]|nr:efflux RND transporter periplasmic adaptor subunit [Patescibacteria group bacterium]